MTKPLSYIHAAWGLAKMGYVIRPDTDEYPKPARLVQVWKRGKKRSLFMTKGGLVGYYMYLLRKQSQGESNAI